MRPRISILIPTMMLAVLASLQAQTASRPGPGGSVDDGPTVVQIMGRAIARAMSQDEAKTELMFESLIQTTVDRLDEDEIVTDTQTTLYRRYALEGALYQEVVERNGEPLGADELAEEHERRQEFLDDLRQAAADGKRLETDDERQVRFDEELMSRYRAELAGEEIVRGERCWVVDFESRDGKLPEHTRMDKALNRSTGRLFVSQVDYGIMRIEFELQRPVRYVWGLVASLRAASGRLEFTRVEPNIWLPEMFDFRLDMRVFFRTMRRHVVREWVERARVVEAR